MINLRQVACTSGFAELLCRVAQAESDAATAIENLQHGRTVVHFGMSRRVLYVTHTGQEKTGFTYASATTARFKRCADLGC